MFVGMYELFWFFWLGEWISVTLRKFEEQPGWLKGGKLRDYQLDGLNFMVNRHVRYIDFRAHQIFVCIFFLNFIPYIWQLEKWYKCNTCWWNGPWKDCAICIHSWIFTGNIIKLKRSNLCLFLHILLILITCFRIHNNYMVLSLLSYHFLQSQIGPKNSENGSQIWMWWSMLVIEPVERYII